MKRKRFINPIMYAMQLTEYFDATQMVAVVLDSDLKLVVRMYEGSPEDYESGDAELLTEINTGLNGYDDSSKIKDFVRQLVEALIERGVTAIHYNPEEIGE